MSEKAVKTIGVLTSGGDAPGMNAAIRAVVRAGLSSGLKVKGIRRGYAGLLEEDIVDMDTMSVSDIVQKGGTILYTSRCPEMVTPEGQKKAADICRKHGIDEQLILTSLVQNIRSVLTPPATRRWKQSTKYVIHPHPTSDAVSLK